jgi:hypothetical protein
VFLAGGGCLAPRIARTAAEPDYRFSPHRVTRHNRRANARLPQRIAGAGYVDDQNVTIDDRLGENHSDRLEAESADLVRRRVAVIVMPISTSATLAAQAATSIIPIVFLIGADPTNKDHGCWSGSGGKAVSIVRGQPGSDFDRPMTQLRHHHSRPVAAQHPL